MTQICGIGKESHSFCQGLGSCVARVYVASTPLGIGGGGLVLLPHSPPLPL